MPELVWSIDHYSAADNTGTVYTEGGGEPSIDDTDMCYPDYMVYIRSSDWALAERRAKQIKKMFHKRANFTVTEEGSTYFVYLIAAQSEPLRLGTTDSGIMEYSINFRVTLREV